MKDSLHNTFLSWVVSAAAFALAAVLSKAYDILGLKYLLFSTFLVFLMLLINSIVISKVTSNRMVSVFSEKLSLSETNNDSSPKLKTNEEMAKIELEVDSKKIILLTPNLENDTDDTKYIGMLRHNIKRNIKYIYILPETESIKAKAEGLKEIFSGKMKLLDIIFVSEKIFFSLTHSHVVIYFPKKGRRKIFMELPMTHNNTKWWVEMDGEYSSLFYNKLISNIPESEMKF